MRSWLAHLPFRVRLMLGFGTMIVVLFGGLALLLHTLVENSLDQALKRSLQTRAADVTSLVSGRSRLPSLPQSDGTFAMIVSGDKVLASTPGGRRYRSEFRTAISAPTFLEDGDRAWLLAEPVATRPRAVLVVGASLAQRNRAMTTLSETLFAGGPLLLLLTCLAGYVLAARALAPVEQMRTRADEISGSEGERLPLPVANDELRRLGETLNEMLARVEESLTRERTFLADMAHELRTPLAIIKLELELALESEGDRAETEERISSAAEEAERLIKIARNLLMIARAEQGRLPLEVTEIDSAKLLESVAGRFGQPAADRGRTVTVSAAEDLIVRADQTWLEQMLANLVSNALRHGDGEVSLAASLDGADQVSLHVLDRGPGFDQGFLDCAFERFSSNAEARGTST
ncbi:MAG: HAMP domain-containing histidine kinase, partial [Solirubrobacterales bacterium]|nr:HAMP domain-containing histidine kinase [Solirubrobacterales bacterium]